jgi:DNA (cytosine-5)-methyltransferase 1
VCYSLKGNAIDRNTAQNGRPWSDGAAYTLDATDRHGVCYGIDQQGGKGNANYAENVMPALCSDSHGTPHGVCYAPNGNHCGNYEEADVSATLQTRYHYGSGGDAAAVVYDCRGNGDGENVPTMTGDHQRRVSDYSAVTVYDTTQITSPQNKSKPKPGDPCHPLAAQQHPPLCVGNGQMCNITMQEVSNTLDCMHDQQAILMQGNHTRKYIVRRLTPLECCRLQGFPDWWEDGVEGSDSARYKMWGNGIALPCAVDVLGRIVKEVADNGQE